jgi:hypothetical protein
MFVIAAAIVLGMVTLWVLAPIFGWGAGEEPHDEAAAAREELLSARREILAQIKDLDMEFQIGKLTREDYDTTRERLTHEAVGILKQMDAGAAAGPRAHAKGARSTGAGENAS